MQTLHDNAADHDGEGDLDEDGVDQTNNEVTPSKIELERKTQHQPPSGQIHQVQLGASYVLLAKGVRVDHLVKRL